MRRFISLGLIVGLLIVSAAPMVPASEMCGLDAMQKHTGHAMSHATVSEALHGPALDLPADTCRLECGCGCHSSIDTLPHLLVPHTVPLCACDALPTEHAAIALPLAEFAAHTPAVSTPPPRNV